jgi:hypothetical protein
VRLSAGRVRANRARFGESEKGDARLEHIYSKIDATNRVTASLFAVQHGLSCPRARLSQSAQGQA